MHGLKIFFLILQKKSQQSTNPSGALTELHLFALVQHEVLEVLHGELLGADEGAAGAHHDVRAVVLQRLLVLGDGQAAEEHANLREGVRTGNRGWPAVIGAPRVNSQPETVSGFRL